MRLTLFLVAAVLACSLVACEDSVSPILESDRQFTLFGTLDMASDTQYVRVIPVRPTLESTVDLLDVNFTSIDQGDGRAAAWRDSTVRFSDGLAAHIFYAPFRIRAGNTYAVFVQRVDSDIVTSAQTTVPQRPTPEVMPEELRRILTTQITVRQRIIWDGLEKEPFSIEQWYRFFRISDFSFQDVRLPYKPLNGPVNGRPGAWEVDMNLVRDRDTLKTKIDLSASVALAGLGMRITILDGDFVPPGGAFDPDVLAQPGTLTNVENGFGFVASVGRFSVEWLLADTTIVSLGYNTLGVHSSDVLERLWDQPPGAFERK